MRLPLGLNRVSIAHFLSSLKYSRRFLAYAYRALIEHSRIHQALIVLTIFVLINNVIMVEAAAETPKIPSDVIVSDPYQIAETVRLLGDYTPDIDENPDEIAYSLEERINGGFIASNGLVATGASQAEPAEESPSSPATETPSSERTKDIKYVVQIGDTVSEIGTKFNLKMATLKVKNNLSDMDSIKPGQELIIPADDLSEKALKAAEDRKKASAELAQNGQTLKKIISGIQRGGYGLIIPLRHNGISRGLVGGHTGIDYRANIGTPIMAAAEGVVVVADETGWNGGYGKTILVSHANGMTTRYGHLSRVGVRVGERVTQGEPIGASGSSGRSTGPHLHFELRVNGAARNPF